MKNSTTSFRKLAHLEICLQENTQTKQTTRLEDFHFIHRACSNLDFNEIDISTSLWDKKLDMPLMVAGMTGGHPEVREINELIAKTVEKNHLAMGVGSERAAIENKNEYITESFQIVRKFAPNTLLMGNLGVAQFSNEGSYGISEIQQAIDLIQADALAIHVNPAQEVVQLEGDTNFFGFWENIQKFLPQVSVPVILKEVGSGFSQEDAKLLENSLLAGVDVGGTGGTSWVAVESLRAQRSNQRLQQETGQVFWDWGIPTALSVLETRHICKDKIIIATGGVRNGLEMAKLLALGADIVGMAMPFLHAANKGEEELEYFVQKIKKECKMALFLTGCRNIQELRKVPMIVTGFSKDWLEQRHIPFLR
ncbi:MAG: type 2 isopentenyl-diphosphate Delta-isomerase [Planctomycetes bacterium]|nr:type 2 isopentenyl-diphosphate Delta-isomerase [Planctomycetota bacterium]HON44197.1 type 2 isopentenyl-diphosphate Delta-isomerase [Planctomycetota bacterium]HRU52190.1 type 2 isopentenyl-diphosphate Delta-isomerase [Planctomycetota bacterium]